MALELRLQELIREMFLIHRYVARLTWRFRGRELASEKVLSGHVANGRETSRRACVDKANSALDRILRRIAGTGIRVNGGERRFDYSQRGNAKGEFLR